MKGMKLKFKEQWLPTFLYDVKFEIRRRRRRTSVNKMQALETKVFKSAKGYIKLDKTKTKVMWKKLFSW